ncbi:MAG TPA: DNA mismatch repair endonuclease MutL, partial [Opitutus sp.]|nr:DNA mismatch repair endonuclease MutL [Opitutus sp.]
DDALLALERHATSKIADAGDLDRLVSYGFRGEALPSIASVSRFELQTREATNDVGTEILVNGGKFVHVRDCGRPVGTRIEVTHLFNSVPARRKFLKTDQTEGAHIVQCVRLYALACPQTSFTLIEDGRVIFRSPECATLAQRIAEIFGRQTAESLVSLEAAETGLRLTGLIGRPGIGRGTRHEMIVFVNQRPVDSRTLNYALIESYHESIPKGRYPLAFVFFECDPAAVDVNVHPAKREVRFRSEPVVRSFVIRAVLQRLRELGDASGRMIEPVATNPVLATESSVVSLLAAAPVAAPMEVQARARAGVAVASAQPATSAQPFTRDTSAAAASTITPPARIWSTNPFASSATGLARSPMVTSTPSATPPEPSPPTSAAGRTNSPGPAWRFVGLAHGSYALFETDAGLVLLDRRAAHERVWFERLQEQFRAGAVPSQRLLLPVPMELDPIAASLLLDRLAFLNAHGFEISEFGRNFYRVEAVPAWMEPADSEPFLRNLLGAFREGRWPDTNPELAREELARLAVSKAIRLPQIAGDAELRGLVTQLFATRTPLTSPSGRPTFIELNHGELSRRFQK